MPIFVSLLLLNEAVSSGASLSGALAEFSNIETNLVSHFAAASSSPFKCSPFKVATPKFRSYSLSRNFFGQTNIEQKILLF